MKYQPPYGAADADAPYVNGDPTIARQGSIIPAGAVEFPQREIISLIENSNLTPTDDDLDQLTRATRSQFINFCVDTGSVNNLSVALTPALNIYKQGMPLRVLVGHTNTGPCVINVNNLGGRPIRRPNGSELQPSDLVGGMVASIVDDGTAFQLQNFQASGGGTGGGGDTIINNYQIKIPYTQDTSGTINQITAVFTPPITAVAPGDPILVRVANTNTGAVTITVNGLAAQPVRRNDGQPLQARDLFPNEVALLIWNVTFWQFVRLVRSQVAVKLSANLTLYVRPDGNDNNDGSANDPAHAFRTPQAALDYVKHSFIISGRTVIIQFGVPGTYQGSLDVRDVPGSIIVRGDPSNISGYVLLNKPFGPDHVPKEGNPVLALYGSGINVTISGFTLTNQDTQIPNPGESGTNIIDVYYGASLACADIALSGTPTTGGAFACFYSTISVSSYIHLYGTVNGGFGCGQGTIVAPLGFCLINTHGINFNHAFCIGNGGALISFSYGYCQFAGGATGPRYALYLNSSLDTYGGPSNFLPGSSAGYKDASSAVG